MGRKPTHVSGFRPIGGVGAVAAALAAAALFALVAAAPAGAAARRVPATCHGLVLEGESYGLMARGIRCSRAHRWAARYQRRGVEPPHWSCFGGEEFTEEGGCQDRRSNAYFTYYAED